MLELLAALVFVAVALAVILLFKTTKRPLKCSSCGRQTVVESRREANSNMVASGASQGDVTSIIGSGRPSVVYMVTYKCVECDEEVTLQSSRR